MASLLVMYKKPQDAAAFDKYYFSTHIPIASKIPGLRKCEISQGSVVTPAGPSGFHLIAMLHFDDMAALQAAMGSPEGQATVDDLKNFVTDPPNVLMFDDRAL